MGFGDEEEPEELLNLDPNEWKVRLERFFLIPTSKLCFILLSVTETRSLRRSWAFSSPIHS